MIVEVAVTVKTPSGRKVMRSARLGLRVQDDTEDVAAFVVEAAAYIAQDIEGPYSAVGLAIDNLQPASPEVETQAARDQVRRTLFGEEIG